MKLIRGAAVGIGLIAFAAGAVVTQPAQADSSDYSLLFPQFSPPVRWNPCRAITWDTRAVPRSERVRLTAAFRAATAASGIRFRAVRRKADISVRFRWTNAIAGEAGRGGARVVILPNGSRHLALGALSLTPPRTATEAARITIYMHEIGHVIGLGHARLEDEVMYPAVTVNAASAPQFGPGDRRGLAALGSKGGCVQESPQFIRR